MESFTKYLPPLGFHHYKGQSGKIAIIGGCFEYTGAPYFAAATVLLLGGDLSHIFCTENAATAIKSYAPELIVHPYIPDKKSNIEASISLTEQWFPRIDAFVIGPGLGRDPITFEYISKLIPKVKATGKPCVIDGDALFFATQNLDMFQGIPQFIFTPNGGEFIRLRQSLKLPENATTTDIANSLKGITVFAKGFSDEISNGINTSKFFFEKCSPRRVGGQGDIFAGAMALFVSLFGYFTNVSP